PPAGAVGVAGGRAAAVWFSSGSSTRRSALGLACAGRQRRVGLCARNLRQPRPGLLWIAHQPADTLAHGAVADQTARGPEGKFASEPGTRAGVGPGARSQNAAAQ